jgi:peptidoglycan-associated lipoprotein
VIRDHANYLLDHPEASVTLSGHTDERGSREYNIALGERRAESVKRLLLARGVSAQQVNVVSYGEEKPAVAGHGEEAWSKNRRVAFNYR